MDSKVYRTLGVPAFNDNYIWLMHDGRGGPVLIVDPGDGTAVLDALHRERLTPAAILITHHHRDHTGGIAMLRDHYDIPVYAPASEAITGCTHPLTGSDRITPPGTDIHLEVITVPGHTSGHIAYYGHGLLFIGDTLFMAGCGRLFEGTAAQMHDSLMRIARLPDDTLIHCAHEYTLTNLRFAYMVEPDNVAIRERLARCEQLRRDGVATVPGTLAEERRTNPFLRTHIPAVIGAATRHAGHTPVDAVEVFAILRAWKDDFRP